jgi:hypothetical protein
VARRHQDSRELAGDLADAIDKLALAASRISGKPGKLALDALALQMQAHVKALEYVHGKQPISVDIAGKVDLVIFAPELLKQHGIDPRAAAGGRRARARSVRRRQHEADRPSRTASSANGAAHRAQIEG